MTRMGYWEDRLSPEQHKKVSVAMEKFGKGKKTKYDQDKLYELLTNMGVLPEEADEIINIELVA